MASVLPAEFPVDCWIGVSHEVDRRVVRLAGRLTVAQIPDLLQTCAEGGNALVLDLTDLISADAAGIEALQRIRAMGASLIGVPGYLQLKLDSPPDGTPGSGPQRLPRRPR
jgi:hypothetical protein